MSQTSLGCYKYTLHVHPQPVRVPTRARDLPSSVREIDVSRALDPYARLRTQGVCEQMCAQRDGDAEGARDRRDPWRRR